GLPGNRVVMGTALPFTFMGQQRTGASNLAITVDPRNSSRVYIAWADQPPNTSNQTLHVRRSTDRGVTWSNDLLAVGNAVNPALGNAFHAHHRSCWHKLGQSRSAPRQYFGHRSAQGVQPLSG